ncbi:MAG: single-stranded DNA-binding protein [Verrucomicrobiota bacterium]
MNQAILSGNLTADVETREIGDKHLSKFTLACNEGDRVVFLPVECWNQPHLADYLFKGSKAMVAGSLKQDQWETEAGEKRSRIVLTAYKVDFLSPRGPSGGSSSGGRPSSPGRSARRSGAEDRRNRPRQERRSTAA